MINIIFKASLAKHSRFTAYPESFKFRYPPAINSTRLCIPLTFLKLKGRQLRGPYPPAPMHVKRLLLGEFRHIDHFFKKCPNGVLFAISIMFGKIFGLLTPHFKKPGFFFVLKRYLFNSFGRKWKVMVVVFFFRRFSKP